MLVTGRAMLTNARLLILDEATEGLAPLVRREIWACLSTLKAAGTALLVIDKNVREMGGLIDRHHLIEKGRVAWHGSHAALLADPALLGRYLGLEGAPPAEPPHPDRSTPP